MKTQLKLVRKTFSKIYFKALYETEEPISSSFHKATLQSSLQGKLLRKYNFVMDLYKVLLSFSVSFSQISCFKALYKRGEWSAPFTEHPVRSLLHENNLGNAIFYRIAQSTIKICHWNFFEAAALKCSTKKAMASSTKSENFFKEITQSVIKFFSKTHLR